MFRQVATLFRGLAHDAGERFTDRHALLILEQQIRDAARAVAAARKAVAIAIAQNAQEARQHQNLRTRITDLESRAVAALNKGLEDLAREAAETIAQLEAESEVSQQALAVFEEEITRLKANVRAAEAKLRDVQRGQRLASATEAAQRMRGSVGDDNFQSLAEAEATLFRLRQRQQEFDLTQRAMVDMDPRNNPSRMSEKLAEAGCGDPIKPRADDVLARLRKRAEGGDDPTQSPAPTPSTPR